MKIRIPFIVGLALVFATSCTPVAYTQLFKTKAQGPLKNVEGSYVYENDTVKISYDFWAHHGRLTFTVYNKLNIPIYIDWRKSSFIKGDEKIDYWKDIETINSATIGAGRGYSENKNVFSPTISVPENGGVVTYGTVTDVGNSVTTSASVSKSVKTKQERITFLAPHTSIMNKTFALFPAGGISFDKSNLEFKDVPTSYDTTKRTIVAYRRYNPDETILNFRNFLSLSTNENFSNEFYIDNSFYVSEVLTIERMHFLGTWKSILEYNYAVAKNFYISLDQTASEYFQREIFKKVGK